MGRKRKSSELAESYRKRIKKINEYVNKTYIKRSVFVRKDDVEAFLKERGLEDNKENREKAIAYLIFKKFEDKITKMIF